MDLSSALRSIFFGSLVVMIGIASLPTTMAQSNVESVKNSATPNTQVVVPQSVTVTIEAFQFKPNTLTIKRGTTVTFVNKDGAPHTVTPEKGAKFIGSGRLQKNDRKQVKFSQVGKQSYFCEIHPSMKGQITVTN